MGTTRFWRFVRGESRDVADLEKRHGGDFSNFRVDMARLFSTGGRTVQFGHFPKFRDYRR
jgi:hypothetical protein